MKDVTEIIEIVFEGVQLEKIVEFLIRMLSNSKLKDYSISTDSSEINLESKEKMFENITQFSDGAIYFNFLDFSLRDLLLLRVGLQVYKYNGIYDMSLDIEENELKHKTSISDFQKHIAFLAEELKTRNYYCGYEPAADEETRLFSKSILGPLNNWRNNK